MKCSKWAGLLCASLFFGCSDEREPIPDAGAPAVDAAVKDADAGPADASQLIDARPDSFIDLFDVFPLPDGGCPGCIRDRCGAGINACFNNPACVTGLFCTLQNCATGLLGDSGFNPANIACVLGCFNGDQLLAFQALNSFTCLTMTCGGACNFLDAGADARPPVPDGQVPDASTDAPPADDASLDVTAPDTGPGTDSGDNDGDGAPPADDATGTDVGPETGVPPDVPPASDATADTAPPGDAPASDATPPDVTPPDDASAD